MRKILMTVLCTLVSALAIAQIVMVIEKSDNTTIRLCVDDVRRVFFDKAMVLEKNDNTTEKINIDEVRRVYFESDDSADVVGEPIYTASYSWNGDTYTAKVVKTIPHTNADDEVQTFEKSVTVSLSDHERMQEVADNTNVNFQKRGEVPTSSSTTDLPWTVKTYSTRYGYTDANLVVSKAIIIYVNDAEITFSDGAYQHTFDVRADITTSARFGEPTVENGYEVTPYYFTITATIGEKTLTNTRIIDICIKRCNSLMSAHIDGTYEFKAQSQIDGAYNVDNWKLDISAVVRTTRGTYRLSKSQSVDVKYLNVFVPTEPHLGKAKAFYVTAVYDPEEGATKRAFISLWEKGVKFAVLDFDRLFSKEQDYKVCLDTYAAYNAVGYDPDAAYHWRPARCERIGNTLYWYRSDGTIMSTMTESECQAVGWENVVDGQYAIEVPGYSYSITDLGYVIEYVLPNSRYKSAYGTYVQSMVVTY